MSLYGPMIENAWEAITASKKRREKASGKKGNEAVSSLMELLRKLAGEDDENDKTEKDSFAEQ